MTKEYINQHNRMTLDKIALDNMPGSISYGAGWRDKTILTHNVPELIKSFKLGETHYMIYSGELDAVLGLSPNNDYIWCEDVGDGFKVVEFEIDTTLHNAAKLCQSTLDSRRVQIVPCNYYCRKFGKGMNEKSYSYWEFLWGESYEQPTKVYLAMVYGK